MGQFDSNGAANYTAEVDIANLARILTGWQVDEFRFRTDPKPRPPRLQAHKTVFGQTASPAAPIRKKSMAELIDFLFARPRIANRSVPQPEASIRTLLIRNPDEAFVQEMAQIFVDNDYEIRPVVRALIDE